MQSVFDELANGNGRPFMDVLGDDVNWRVIGSSPWSRTYEGKQAVTDELMRPLFHQFADQYRARATRITAEDDIVVGRLAARQPRGQASRITRRTATSSGLRAERYAS